MYTSRLIRNLEEITRSLSKLNSIDVAVVDLASLSFSAQMRLVAAAGLIIGVHGAGIPSAMHMSIGSDLCCGVIEIFPQGIAVRFPSCFVIRRCS
jgi:capsular polysaccharide biosynthesis protein